MTGDPGNNSAAGGSGFTLPTFTQYPNGSPYERPSDSFQIERLQPGGWPSLDYSQTLGPQYAGGGPFNFEQYQPGTAPFGGDYRGNAGFVDTSGGAYTPFDVAVPGAGTGSFGLNGSFSPGTYGGVPSPGIGDLPISYPGIDYSFSFDEPVVLDLDGNGIGITQLSSSNQFFDMAGDGYQHRTAWAAAGDGVLVFDSQGDGVIDQRNEVVFTEWDPTATSDMQALRTVFDTDHDGKLDAGDARFSSFKIWVTNADGTRTLKTLAQLGIVSIGLDEDKTRIVLPDGSSIDGETQFTRTNGTTGTAAAVTLAYEANGTALQSSTTRNADGSTTITSRQLGQDGQLVGETVSKTLADGLTTTITFDRDGNGVIDQRQSSVTVVNADGSRTRTVVNTDNAGNQLDETVTTTSADGKTVTILRDTNGGGGNEESETDVANADGGTSVTTKALNPNGTAHDTIVRTTSADGLTGTTRIDDNGDGVFDLTRTDTTVVGGDGSRTRTVSETNANGSLRDRVLTTTSADGSSKTIKTDADGNGTYELIESSTIVTDGSGNKTTTQSMTNGDGSLRSRTVTTISANGLSVTTKTDSNGDGVVDLTRSDVTVVNGDGSRTQTVIDMNAAGDLIGKTVTTKGSPTNLVRTTQADSDGNGSFDLVDQVTVSGGVTTQVASKFAPNGTTLLGRTTTTTSADGLTQTIQSDLDGGGATDRTVVTATVRNGDGSSTVTRSTRAANNTLVAQVVETVSANALVKTVKSDIDGNGVFDTTTTSTTTSSSGAMTTVVAAVSQNGTLRNKTTTTVSADRNQTSITKDANGDAKTDTTEVITVAANGTVTDVVKTYNRNGAIVSQSTTTTDATGLSITRTDDFDGNGATDQTVTNVKVLNVDGSTQETISTFGPGPDQLLRDRVVRTVSATGLSKTVREDVDGDGTFDKTTTDVTALAANGTRTQTVSHLAGTTLTDKTVITTAGRGLSTTTVIDADGDGDTDITRTDVTTLNADGSRTQTVTEKNGNGSIRDKTVTTISADRKTTTISQDIDGNGINDKVRTIQTLANGSTTDTVVAYNSAGAVIQQDTKTISANGLSTTLTLDANLPSVPDQFESRTTAFNTDGSKTETHGYGVSISGVSANLTKAVTTSSNGLVKTTNFSYTNGTWGPYNHTTTDTTVIGPDGSTTQTINVQYTTLFMGNIRQITTNATNTSRLDRLDVNGDGTWEMTDQTNLNLDGSTTKTYSYAHPNAQLVEKVITTTSADGRSIAIQNDTDGDGVYDTVKSSEIAADGTRTDTTTTTFGSYKSRATIVTSEDGRTKTTSYDDNADGSVEREESLTTVLNEDGSRSQTRRDLNANGTVNSEIVTKTSANGLSITATLDIDGDGTTTRPSRTSRCSTPTAAECRPFRPCTVTVPSRARQPSQRATTGFPSRPPRTWMGTAYTRS